MSELSKDDDCVSSTDQNYSQRGAPSTNTSRRCLVCTPALVAALMRTLKAHRLQQPRRLLPPESAVAVSYESTFNASDARNARIARYQMIKPPATVPFINNRCACVPCAAPDDDVLPLADSCSISVDISSASFNHLTNTFSMSRSSSHEPVSRSAPGTAARTFSSSSCLRLQLAVGGCMSDRRGRCVDHRRLMSWERALSSSCLAERQFHSAAAARPRSRQPAPQVQIACGPHLQAGRKSAATSPELAVLMILQLLCRLTQVIIQQVQVRSLLRMLLVLLAQLAERYSLQF